MTAAGNAESVAFSPDGTLLATAGTTGPCGCGRWPTPRAAAGWRGARDSGTYVYTVVFAPDGRTIAAASTDNLTRLWDIADPGRLPLRSASR